MMNTLNRYKEKIMNTLTQIWRWIMQPKVWIFVGFVSAAIGLICFALSSSFKHLFGDWNFLKIFLYCLVSFIIIIILIILFANKWQLSTTSWFKVIANFLVITLTSLYSYYLDKKVRGKPDAYSLISYAAFTIMSLCLLLQNRCGLGKELMEFFVGCFIVQFMKIKLVFFIPGACFYYFILGVYLSRRNRNDAIVAESHLTQLAGTTDNEDSTSLQDPNINVIVDPHSLELSSSDIGISNMLEKLGDYVKALRQENSTLIEMLMEKLKDYLSGDSGFNVSDTDFMIMALPTETIDNIHKTAKLMVSAGFKSELSDVYSSSRRECLVESLSRLGFKKLSIEDLQMLSWKEIEDEIERWIKAFNVALKILLPTERKLCDRVFFGFSSTADLSFMDVCRESTLQLLNFADVIAIGSGSPERLLRVLDILEIMRDQIIPEFESLFHDQYSGSLQNGATAICKRLGKAIRGIFKELANLIQQNSTKKVNLFNELHPITRYVMNCVCAASQSRKTLEQVFDRDYGDHPMKEYPNHSSSYLSVQMSLIMKLLESKLIDESKLNVRITDLSLLFLIRNGNYIVQKAKECELGTILGDDWFKNQPTQFGRFRLLLIENQKSNPCRLEQEMEQEVEEQTRMLAEKRSFSHGITDRIGRSLINSIRQRRVRFWIMKNRDQILSKSGTSPYHVFGRPKLKNQPFLSLRLFF